MDIVLLLKATVVLSVALLSMRLLRRAPAAARHQLWSLTFAAVLALPLLASSLPTLSVPVPAGWGAPVALSTSDRGTALPNLGDRPVPNPIANRDRAKETTSDAGALTAASMGTPAAHPLGPLFKPTQLLLAAWLTGTTLAAAALLLALLRVRRLARTADDLGDAAWQAAADAISSRLDLRRPPRLLVSASIGTPMAGGVWRPTVFLPADVRDWSAERRDVVLTHEIAHLVGLDPLRHMMVRLALAFYWFHPLAWIAARQAAMAREQACDEVVLALGTRRSTYASVLLALAESMSSSAAPIGALPMVQRSLLETRVMAILNEDVRPATRRLLPLCAFGIVMLTLSVGIAQPVVRASVRPIAMAAAPAVGIPAATPLPVPLARVSHALAPTTGPAEAPQPLPAAASAIQRVPVPFPPTPPAQRPDSDAGTQRTSRTTSGARFELEFQGMLTLSDDDRDVVEISPGGSLRVVVDGLTDVRHVQLSALPDASVDRRYWLSGTERPWEPEGRAWWSEVLPTIVRRSGFGAEQRVARILRSEGPSGVLATIEHLDTDAVRARYFRHLFTQAQFDDVTRVASFDKLGSIDSSRELRTVLEAVAESASDDATLAAAIGATRHMDSSVEIAGFLTGVAARRALQGALRDAYVEAAGRISRAQRSDVLLALGAAGNAR